MASYTVRTKRGNSYTVNLADGEDIESVVAQIEAEEAAAEAKSPAAPVAKDQPQPGFFESAQNFARDAVGAVKGGINAAGDAIGGTFREMVGAEPYQAPTNGLLSGSPDHKPSKRDLEWQSLSDEGQLRALGVDPQAEKARAAKRAELRATADKPRSIGDMASDAAAAFAQGGNSLLSLPVNTVSPGGDWAAWLRENGKKIASFQSPQMRAEQELLAERIAQSPGELAVFRESMREALTNPAYASSFAIQQIPILAALMATRGVGATFGRGMVGAAGRASPTVALADAISGGALAARGAQVGSSTGLAAAGMVASGGDAAENTFSELMDKQRTPTELLRKNADYVALVRAGRTEDEARKEIATSKAQLTGLLAAPLGLIDAMTGLQPMLARRALGASAKKSGASEAIKEIVGEQVQEIGALGLSNAVVQGINPDKQITEGFGRTAAETILGAAPFAAATGVGTSLEARQPRPGQTFDPAGAVDRVFNAPPRVEQQPTTVITPEEILSAPLPQQDQAGSPAAGPGATRATPAAPTTEAGQATTGAAPVVAPINLTDPNDVLATLRGNGPASGVQPGAAGGRADAGGVPGATGALPGGVAAGQPAGGAVNAPGGPVGAELGAGPAPVPAVGSSNVQQPVPQAARADVHDASSGGGGQAVPGGPADLVAKIQSEWNVAIEQATAAGRASDVAGVPRDLRPVSDPKLVEPLREVATAISEATGFADTTGERVVFVESDQMPDGLNYRGRAVVNVKGMQKPAVFIAGHEISHTWQNLAERAATKTRLGQALTQDEADAQRIWTPVEQAIWDMTPDSSREAYAYAALSDEIKGADGKPRQWADLQADPKFMRTLRREMAADFHGKRLSDPDTVNELARRAPEHFGEYAKKVVSWINGAIAKLRGSKGGKLGANDVDQHIKDLTKAKLIWTDAMISWRKRGGAGAQPMAAANGGPSFSARVQSAVASGADLKLDETSPPRDKPVVLAFGGTFNPVHSGHVQAAVDARDLLIKAGYRVERIVVSPSPQSLMRKKSGKDASLLVDRVAMLREAFKGVEGVEIADAPSREADESGRKPNRTDQSDWVSRQYPGRTVVSVAGEDTAPEGGPGFPGLYTPRRGNLEGNTFLAVPRDEEEGISSSGIRKKIESGAEPSAEEASPGVVRYFKATKGLSSEVAVDGVLYDGDAPHFGIGAPPQTLPEGHPLLRSTDTLDAAPTRDGGAEPRSEMARRIVDAAFAGKKPATGRPIAYVMGGGGASGKGTLKAKLAAQGVIDAENAVDIDPDEIKLQIPEYSMLLDAGDSRAADRAHNESSRISTQVADRAMAGGYNIILDKTLSNADKAIKALEELRAKGYEVRLFGVTINPATAIVRAALRAKKTARHVPSEVLLKAHRRFTPNFERIAAAVDSAELFDSTDGFLRIAEKDASGLRILEPMVYNQAVEKAKAINEQATTLNAIDGRSGDQGVRAGERGSEAPQEQADRPGRPSNSRADAGRDGGDQGGRGEVEQGPAEADEGRAADGLDAPSRSARSVYVSRPVENAEALIKWAEKIGIKGLMPASELHVTLAYSRDADPDFELGAAPDSVRIRPGAGSISQYAGNGSVQLKLDDAGLLERHAELAASGAPWQRGEGRGFSLHITLSRAGENPSAPVGRRFPGSITLGRERLEPLRNAWRFAEQGPPGQGARAGREAPSEPPVVNLGEQPSASARSIKDHKMVIEREERATIKNVRLSTAESALIDKAADEIASSTGATAKVIKAAIKAELTRKKASYPQSKGWAPLDFKGADVVKDEDGKPVMDDDGKPVIELRYDVIPYNFHVGAAGKNDAKTEAVRAEAMAMRLKKAAMELIARRDKGDGAAEVMLRQAGWYKNMRQRLRAEFGGFGDFVADLLGATSPNTPVRTNWEFTIEALKMASNGAYDEIMPAIGEWWAKYTAARDAAGSYLQAQLAAGKKKVEVEGKKLKGGGWDRQPDPVYAELLAKAAEASKYGGPEPRRENGKRYGINTDNVLAALGDLWRVVEKGTAPKARNFSGNLVGFRTGATIDVWAARLLRRMANEVINKGGFPRIPPPAEKGVGGKHITQDSVGGEFGFGQAVFNKAAAMLRATGAKEYASIGDDDLQAIVWFLEKELWTKNNWTTVAGEGGSFEQEADLAGTMERDKVKELRRIIDGSKSSPEMREAARRELANYEGTLQRFTGGLSIQQSAENQGVDSVPTDVDMAGVRVDLESAAASPELVAFRAFSTLGRYGADERSFDVEGVTRMGYDLAPLHAKMREVAKRANQDSFFTAKALQPGQEVDLTLHRPGIEIFFSQPIELSKAEPMLAQLREKGVEFFTFITDGRRTPGALAGAMPKVAGVRMIALPEFMARYGDAEAAALAGADDGRVVSYMQQQEDNFRELRNKVDGTPGVSYAEVGHYEVNAEFKEQYDGDKTGAPQGGAGPVGGQGWTGLTVREGLARANPRNGAPGAAGLQDGAGGLRGNDGQPAVDGPSYSARSDAAGDRRDRGVPEGSEQGSPTYGVATPGAAAPVEAIHFSQQQRASLSSGAYGSGLRGAEMERVMRSSDTRLRQRVYFYVNQGTGIRPESGVGAHAHRVTLANLYDTAKGEIKGAGNDFESAVLDAGYDGYLVRLPGSQSGQAVLLGAHSVPVQYLGLGGAVNAAPAPASQASAASSTRQGDDLVSRAAPDVAAIRGKAEVQAVAPSFRFEFGKARVRAEEAERANAALEQLGSELSFSRRSGDLVSPQSVLDAAIDEATRVLEGAIERGGQMAGLGRTSHVLGMLGARPVPLVMDGSVVRKVFIEKHAGKLDGIPVGDIVRGLYRPALVFKQKGKPNEFELVLPVVASGGPLTAAIVVDGDRAAVKSIYPRSWSRAETGPSLRRFMANEADSKPVYADEYLAPIAVTGNEDARAEAGIRKKAGSPSDQRPGVTGMSASVMLVSPAQTPVGSGNRSVARPGAPVNQHFIAWRDFRALAMKFGRLPGEMDLLRWIGDNYQGDPADAPSFSARQTETPEFKRWFGDSKVVDADGKPLVVYHGTPNSFSEFDTFPAFFTTDADAAYAYARGQFARSDAPEDAGPNVMPVFLSFQSPLVLTEAQALEQIGEDSGHVDWTAVDDFAWQAGKAGYDGLIIRGALDYAGGQSANVKRRRYDQYIAFRPEQIKSAIGNDGSFDADDANISSSARQPTLWRDELGRLRSPTGKLAAYYGGILNTWLAKVGLNYMSPELKRQFREMKIQLQKAQDVTVAVARESFKMSEAERELVSDIIEGELKTGVVPPSHAVQMAMGMQAVLGQQTDELVALGMLNKESADLWRGKYLPRFYKPKLTDIKDAWSKALQQLVGRKPIMAGIQGKRLKSRGLWETVTHKSLPKWEALGWQVRDPDYDPATATARTEVQIWRDFTREEREKMGEIRDAGFRFAMGYQQAQRDIAYGRLFKGIAEKIASKREKPGFVQVPDGTVEGTGVRRYGALAGMWVPLEVLQHLKAMDSGAGPAMQMYRKAMSMWKEGKVVLNPVSHANNVLSNISMAHFAGVSFWDQHKYAMAAKDLATGGGYYQEAKDAGLMLGTMGQEELMNMLPPELQALVHQQRSTAGKVVEGAFNALTFSWTRNGEQKGLRKYMAKAYEAEDVFFRYMIYADGRKRGLTPSEAVDHSQRYIFTYDDLPVSAQKIRDFGMPFFAYTYKVIPALLHTAANYPHRLLAPAAMLYGLNAAMYALAAGDDDEDWLEKLKAAATDPERQAKMKALEAEERENLPPWMKGYVSIGAQKAIRLGTDEVLGLPVFWDVGQIMPGGNMFDMQNNTGGVGLPQSLTVSHPLFTTLGAMLLNRDSFFGKDIVDKTDDSGEAALKRAEWMWRQYAPAISFGNYHWERALNILAQQTGGPVSYWPWRDLTGVDKQGMPIEPGYTALQTIGIKVRPVDIERSAEMRDGQNRALMRDIDKELRNFKRMNQAGYMSDTNLERELERAQAKKERLREGLTVDGERR